MRRLYRRDENRVELSIYYERFDYEPACGPGRWTTTSKRLHRIHAVGDLTLLAPRTWSHLGSHAGRTGTKFNDNHAPGPPRRAARMALVMMLLTHHFSIFHAQSTFDLQCMINYSCLQRPSLQTPGTAMCRRVEPRDHQHRYKQHQVQSVP